jgi:YD repeat-containing protein
LAVNGSYDAKGRLASLTQGTDADQRGLAFAYNDQGWLKTVTDPLNRAVNFEPG